MAINKNKVMEVAQKYVEKGQTDKAIKEYLKVVQEDPKDVRVWLKIGDLYAKKGAKEEATQTYLKVAQFYSEQGFYLKAVAVYKQILKLDPRLVDVNLKLADLYRQLGLMSDAAQQYELVAAFYQKEGKSKEALATIRQLADLDPENVATRIKLAELYSKENMAQEAIAEFARAAEYLRSHNRIDDFIKVAERLVWHQPDNHEIQRELATLYLRRNDPRRALQKLQICFKADPRDVKTLNLLAEAFLALDQKSKTVSVWKELARIHQENGQTQQAHEVYRRILQHVPDDAEAAAALGVGGRAAAPAAPAPAAAPAAPYQVVRPIDPVPPAAQGGVAFPRVATPISGVPALRPAQTGAIPLAPDGFSTQTRTAQRNFDAAVDDESLEVVGATERARPAGDLELELDVDDVGVPTEDVVAPPASAPADTHADEIAKILTETDVYVKYGLHQKALEHLKRVFELDPGHVGARERTKDVLLMLGREAEAAAELVKLIELVGASNPEQAEAYLKELLAIDPDNRRAHALADRFQLRTAPAAPRPDRLAAAEPPVAEPSVDLADDEEEFAVVSSEVSAPVVELELDELQVAESSGPTEGLGRAEATQQIDEDQVVLEPEAVDIGDDLSFEDLGAGAGAGTEFSLDPADEAFEESIGSDVVPVPEPVPVSGSGGKAPGGTGMGVGATTGTFSGTGTSLEDDLDEADFFVSQNLFAEARQILEDLLRKYPGHPLLLAKLQDLDVMERASGSDFLPPLDGPAEAAIFTPGPQAEPAPAVRPEPPPAARPSSQSQAAQKKPTVIAKPLGDEDADTHYDLGLAYKEMGLYDEAIKEFSLVLDTPGRGVQCQMMIGLCHSERGQYSEAIAEFKKGLYIEGITDQESLALYFELGACYEALGDAREALYYYEKVAKRDASFRDVGRKVALMKAKVAAESARPGGRNGNGRRDAAGARGEGTREEPARDESDDALDLLDGGSSDEFSV